MTDCWATAYLRVKTAGLPRLPEIGAYARGAVQGVKSLAKDVREYPTLGNLKSNLASLPSAVHKSGVRAVGIARGEPQKQLQFLQGLKSDYGQSAAEYSKKLQGGVAALRAQPPDPEVRSHIIGNVTTLRNKLHDATGWVDYYDRAAKYHQTQFPEVFGAKPNA